MAPTPKAEPRSPREGWKPGSARCWKWRTAGQPVTWLWGVLGGAWKDPFDGINKLRVTHTNWPPLKAELLPANEQILP